MAGDSRWCWGHWRPTKPWGCGQGLWSRECPWFPTGPCLPRPLTTPPLSLACRAPLGPQLPGSALEASGDDELVSEDSIPKASPHWPPSHSTTRPKPIGGFGAGGRAHGHVSHAKESWRHPGAGLPLFAFSAGLTMPAALENPADLPELEAHTFAEAFPELAGDTLQFQDKDSFSVDVTNVLAWLDATDSEDTVPDDLSSWIALLSELLDLCGYAVEGTCPKEQMAGAGLGTVRTQASVAPT